MATFSNTTSPTPFGFFDSESDFSTEADNIVTFVKSRTVCIFEKNIQIIKNKFYKNKSKT